MVFFGPWRNQMSVHLRHLMIKCLFLLFEFFHFCRAKIHARIFSSLSLNISGISLLLDKRITLKAMRSANLNGVKFGRFYVLQDSLLLITILLDCSTMIEIGQLSVNRCVLAMTSTGIRSLSHGRPVTARFTRRSIYVPLMTRLITINDVMPSGSVSRCCSRRVVTHKLTRTQVRRELSIIPRNVKSTDLEFRIHSNSRNLHNCTSRRLEGNKWQTLLRNIKSYNHRHKQRV